MTIRNIPTFLAATCLSPLLLTACAPTSPEAGRPNTAPPSSAGKSTASSGTETPPTQATPTGPPARPSAARGTSLAAGEAFIGFYVSLMNYSSETGDTAAMLAESDKGCIGCKAITDFARKVNARNGGLTGDYKDRLTTVKEIFRGTGGKAGGSATLKSGVYVERTVPTAAPMSHTPSTGTMEFTLLARDGNWVMYEMQINQ